MQFSDNINKLGEETAFEVQAKANALEATGIEMIHMELSEPRFETPEHIKEAAIRAINDGILDVIVGLAMIKDESGQSNGLQAKRQGRVYCLDGGNGDILWYRDYADGGNYGDVNSSPMVVDYNGEAPEDVIILLDRVSGDDPHIEVLEWVSPWGDDDVDVLEEWVVSDDGENPCEGLRANGAFVDPSWTGGDPWLVCVSAGNTINMRSYDANFVHIIDLTDGSDVITPVEIEHSTGDEAPCDVLGIDFVHIGPVVGDVDGDDDFEIILPRRGTLHIIEDDGTLYDADGIEYSGIKTAAISTSLATLSSSSSASACRNVASCPALGDLNHNGVPDIVIALDSWVVALCWDDLDEGLGYPKYETVWTINDPNAQFWTHPALADMTRDGYLDVVVCANPDNVEYNVLGFDGSPANFHNLGNDDPMDLSDRRLFAQSIDEDFQALGQGAGLGNVDSYEGHGVDTLYFGTVFSQYLMPLQSGYAIYDSDYEGHNVQFEASGDKYEAPSMWPKYLYDRYNSACYEYDPS